MLVYSNDLTITTSSGDSLQAGLDSMRAWLSRKCRVPIADIDLTADWRRSFPDGKRIEAYSTIVEFPEHPRIHAVRFSHPDRDVSGRLWVTELGLRQMHPGAETRAS